MTPYNNPNSGIASFEPGTNWLIVQYKNGKSYKYISPPLAQHQIDTMIQYAESQDGLGTYINKNRDVYDAGELIE